MANRRKRLKTLTATEIERLLAAGEELHRACVTPRVDVTSEHYRAIVDLNRAIYTAIEIVTGREPPWTEHHAPFSQAQKRE